MKHRIAEMTKEDGCLYLSGNCRSICKSFISQRKLFYILLLLEVSSEIFQCILEFMYSGSCSVPEDKVSEVSILKINSTKNLASESI